MANISTTQLVAAGGSPPYSFTAPLSDPKTSLPNGSFSVSGSTLTIDSSNLSTGFNTLHVIVTDSNLSVADMVLNIQVVDPTQFLILNNNQNYEPSSFPSNYSMNLSSNGGGSGVVTWSILPSVTSLPGVVLSGNTLNFTLSSYGTWTVGVQATNAVGVAVSKVLEITSESSQVASLVDGQVEVMLTVPAQKVGVNQFTLKLSDSASNQISKNFYYKAENPISNVQVDDFAFDHYWGSGDTTSVVIPISGYLSGYSVNTSSTILPNGLTLLVDGINDVVKVTGPPTSFANSQTYLQLPVLQGSNQVATITREYTLISHQGTEDIGEVQCFTRPYLVGELVGLNALKPWFNSPDLAINIGYSTRVQSGSLLPTGLSLDSNTALVYGTLLSPAQSQSVLEYYDSENVVHGTVTITWDTQVSLFSLIDNLVDGNVQQSYTGSIASSSSVALTNASVYRGRLPQGLSMSVNAINNTVDILGTPTEAGYFDLWFRVGNQNGQTAYLYRRFVVNYINPLVILTSSLPLAVTNQPYNGGGFVFQGFGGYAPYTWSLDVSSPVLPTGMTLNSAGLLSGTPSQTSYSSNIVVDLTDARGVSTSAVLNLVINNSVQITTSALPKIIPGQNYSFSMAAQGGSPPYTWSESGQTLPQGINFSSSTGVFSGVTSVQNYSQSVTISVADSAGGSNHTDSKTYSLQTGVSAMLIDDSGVGPVDRGAPYQGTLRLYGTFTSPITWQVSPDSPNNLPSGLTLQATSSNNGVTAVIGGSTTTLLSGYSVKISAIDAQGSSTQVFVILNSTSSLAITTQQLPVGIVTGNYNYQLVASGYNSPFTWSISSGALPSGYSLSSSGVISGSASAVFNANPVFQVTDSLGDTYPLAPLAQAPLNLVVQSSGLLITTKSINQITSGLIFTQTLAATGASGNYSWSISPSSPNQLPVGLSLATTGQLMGTTTQTGFSKNVGVRVTDISDGAFTEQVFQFVVVSGLSIVTGIDYTDGLTTNCLGYVTTGSTDSISPRPNYSFYAVATGVVTTNAATLASTIVIGNTGFSAVVDSLTNGVAYIRLSGPFASGTLGVNTFSITIMDSGVSATGNFQWTVYNDGSLNLIATNAFPRQLAE